MTWTYTNDPANNTLDRVRLTLGDTDECDQILSDEELNYFILNAGGCSRTASIEACFAIMAKYSRFANESVGSVSIQNAEKSKQYKALADQIRVRMSIYVTPIAGGINVGDKRAVESDSNRVNPSFNRDLHDNGRDNPPDEREN